MESYDFLQTSSNGSYGYKDKIFNKNPSSEAMERP